MGGSPQTLAYLNTGVDIAATTLTDLYTVPAAYGANYPRVKMRSVMVTNRGVAGTFRIAYAPLGAADAIGQYIAYDCPLAVGETVSYNFDEDELTLVPTDVIRGYSNTGDMTFHVFGKVESE